MPSAVGGGQSWLVGKSPSTGEETGVQVRPSFAPPLHLFPVGSQSGHGWMSGRLYAVVVPAAQSPVPEPLAVTLLITQVLVAAEECEPFGTGSGGPKRQPAFVQCRKLHVPPGQSAFVVHEL